MTTDAAGSPSLSFRVSKVLDRAAIMGRRLHDMRIGRQPAYVDGSRSDQNTTLALVDGYDKQGSAWSRFFSREEQELAARRKQQSKTQKMWRSAILTFSKAAQELLTTPPDAEALAVFRDFARRHNVRLLWSVGHRDESAAHYHAMFENVTGTGYALRLGVADLSAEQDIAAWHFRDLGINRGKSKRARIADGEDPSAFIHRSVRELHHDLPAELDAARKALAESFVSIEKNQALAEKARLKAEEYTGDAQKALQRAQRYEERAQAAQQRWEAAQARLEALEAREKAVSAQEAALTAKEREFFEERDDTLFELSLYRTQLEDWAEKHGAPPPPALAASAHPATLSRGP